MYNTNNEQHSKKVYLEGSQTFYGDSKNVSKVAPVIFHNHEPVVKAFEKKPSNKQGIIFEIIRPILYLQRLMGIAPVAIADSSGCVFKVSPKWLAYSVVLFLIVVGMIGYIKWDRVDMVRSSEGRFEEAVIDYLFTVYLVPIVINLTSLYEARKQAKVITELIAFEKIFNRVSNKKLTLYFGNKPMMVAIALPIISCATMVVTHATMANFRLIQALPYCFINTVTYIVGGSWFIFCEVIAETATIIAEDFQKALKNIGPSTKVADYRSLWMMLSRLTRDVSNAVAYTLSFLCLYLFLIITLTIYGLLSQIQEGLGVKDIGLVVTAVFAVILLFFICDEAHGASNCVRVQFQKKLLLVELSWMNDDAQQEINMFLRATEMNPTDMSLGGFFDVNRNLFKSLLATMVTYLVVLLQFQISIPEDTRNNNIDPNSTTTVTLMTAVTKPS